MSKGKVEIYQTRTQSGWRFRLRDPDGKTVATSELYDTKDAAALGLAVIKVMLSRFWSELEFSEQ